ncbi:MAG: Acetyltransferase [Chloroflexi bacterium]|nr:Acetyltransferase [Chloroflexota bacterium]
MNMSFNELEAPRVKPSLILRDAQPEEFGAASEIIRAAYAEYASGMPTDRWERYIERSADVWSRTNEAELIVAEVEGHLLGAVTFYPEGSAYAGEGWPQGCPGIRLLAVVPDGRRNGIGHALIDECIRRARARGSAAVGLHTTERMAVAKAMYERIGFQRVPTHDFGASVLAYRLDLQPTLPAEASQQPPAA